MKRLQKGMLRVALCCVLFAIACGIYTEFDKKRFRKSLQPLSLVEENPVHTHQGGDSQTHTDVPIMDTVISTIESPTGDYDWRSDDMNAPTDLADNTDPWENWWEHIENQELSADVPEDVEDYPPKDWHRTTDPVLFAEYYRAQLTNQFGDLPQVDILADGYMKIKAEIPMTLDEKIEHVEAMYDLFPDEKTRETIAFLKEWKASGNPFKMEFGPPPPSPPADQFLDIKPFVERYGWEDGIAKFRQINPERVVEFERIVNQHQH
ncbi:hypothetical protein F4X88_10375 [Candidatus Poribacteria bacterium]|nr:hypothetical protein [Candidatus Poribacteria bacterium]MYA56690.1 hypothetical protein [Candidatus Poribacteria bacterium]